MEDIVREMGYLCLGSRFKRIGERLQGDVQRFIDQSGLEVQTGQYPLLAALYRAGALTVGGLVEALGVSQPGVTRNVVLLENAGLVEVGRVRGDRRQKSVALSAAGRRLIERSERDVWPYVEAAVAELCAGMKGPLLDQLSAIEGGLFETPLDERAAKHAKPAPRRTRASRSGERP